MTKPLIHPSMYAESFADRAAYIMAASGEAVSYAALESASNRFAHWARSAGLRHGDHIALVLVNDARFFEIVWGAQRCGLYFTLASTKLSAADIAFIAGDCGAKALLILFDYYGGTEAVGVVSISSQEWLEHRGSVGRPAPGQVVIADEAGRILAPGEIGDVYFTKGRQFEYHNDPEKTRQAYNDKGWSTLGDIGYLDEDGYLYLTDRRSDVVISGGVNIYPQEIEHCLCQHEKVAAAAVFGVPNEEFGEELKAVVQPMRPEDSGPALEAVLMAYCAVHLSKFKRPRTIEFLAQLPRHETGKLYKRLLRDKYWAGRQSKLV